MWIVNLRGNASPDAASEDDGALRSGRARKPLPLLLLAPSSLLYSYVASTEGAHCSTDCLVQSLTFSKQKATSLSAKLLWYHVGRVLIKVNVLDSSLKFDSVISFFKTNGYMGLTSVKFITCNPLLLSIGLNLNSLLATLAFREVLGNDENVIIAIRNPRYNQVRINKELEFFMNELKYELVAFMLKVFLLTYNLEKWIIPRYKVLLALKDKGLIRRDYPLRNALSSEI
ncbi:hypothetical protein Cgig2_012081 [Carnegiea gigantea]|uniref:Uncharacterized protein n=1 Tax=Carnegiea gigantea TaxID=171969 RepID=A0A9Q1JNT3_9CARY|nr:hypothetical protein Cgig2_012081 [Carnegiea gigantea]